MKTFDIPLIYRSPIISKIKGARKNFDPKKKDFTPTVLDFGPVRFFIARHFGFCYGVENAIEIAYKTIEENPNKKIYLLSEMIHNPDVNSDLLSRGVKFLMDTSGRMLTDWSILNRNDIVIVPAFGTTVEIENKLLKAGLDVRKFNTTCPFVEKVWNRSKQLGQYNYTVIIHGKNFHEETRATFSHTVLSAPSVVVRNTEETKILGSVILGKLAPEYFYEYFDGKYSEGFNVEKDLQRLGVVNQTTMLATETQAIADYLKKILILKYGIENIKNHFADTRDTLCYATSDNQQATYGLLNEQADFAVVVGGYNSSNTSHIVELCREKLPTYFVSGADKILSENFILHFDLKEKKEVETKNFIPEKKTVDIILTSGASCPDAVVEQVLMKLLLLFRGAKPVGEVMKQFDV